MPSTSLDNRSETAMNAEAMQQMLRDDRDEWDALCAVLDAHPDRALHDPESPDWTARDVYAHLARMMQCTTALLAKLADVPVPAADAFDEFDGGDENAVNARIQQRYSHLGLDEARGWAQRVFDERIGAIEAVQPERWDAQLEGLARADGGDHYRGHRSYVSADISVG